MDTTYSYTTTSADLTSAQAAALGGFMLVLWLIVMVLIIFTIASMWKLFTKAGKPGWAAIVPIYNNIVQLEIVGRPIWWVFLYFIPFVNIVAQILVTLDTAKVYGKDTTFGVLMIFFPIPMYQILAFSKSTQYLGPIAHEQAQYGAAPAAPVASQPVVPTPQAQPAAPMAPQSATPDVQPPVTPDQPQQ